MLWLPPARAVMPLDSNNGSEGDIRGFVKWRKISGGTRSGLGRCCRHTFFSLKITCRKLGISFRDYRTDRIEQTGAIPRLPNLLRERMLPSVAMP